MSARLAATSLGKCPTAGGKLFCNMDELAFLGLYVFMLVVPAAFMTATLAIVMRTLSVGRTTPKWKFTFVGSIVPAGMAIYGLVLSWPWALRRTGLIAALTSKRSQQAPHPISRSAPLAGKFRTGLCDCLHPEWQRTQRHDGVCCGI